MLSFRGEPRDFCTFLRKRGLSAEDLTAVVAYNRDLFRTVNHLVEGD